MTTSNNLSPKNWVIITSIGFLASVAFLLTIILLPNFKEIFRDIGGLLYYVILIPFALICAGFLFGALSSYAKASGKNIHGTIELGGPVVVFVLVLWGGIQFNNEIQKSDTFFLQIFFLTDNSSQNVTINGSANIIIEGSTIGNQTITDNEIRISLPSSAKTKRIGIIPSVKNFSTEPIYHEIPIDSNSINVYLKHAIYNTVITGYVFNDSKKLVEDGYTIDWGGVTGTIISGKYELKLPYAIGSVKPLKIFHQNNIIHSTNQVIPDGSLDVLID